jgi:DNA polymerase-4
MSDLSLIASMRKILHLDMDAFYASVEQRDNPDLLGKPVAVGGSRERGVVAAASYEARVFGVRSAMSSRMAYQRCPELIFVRPRFDVYKEVSKQIRAIFLEYTDLVEPLSLDEAYLDVTSNKKNIASAQQIARQIKEQIHTKTGLTASAGVSINKFIAKIASDYQKPNGLTVITPNQAEAFVAQLAVDKFYGVGKVTARKMHELGIHSGADMKKWEESALVKHFGKAGHFYYNIARAVDERPVNPNRIRKSIGSENTFDHDITELDRIKAELYHLALDVLASMDKYAIYGKTLTLKVKFADFQQITRSKTGLHPIHTLDKLIALVERLVEEVAWVKSVRLLGLTVSGLDGLSPVGSRQLTLGF